MLMVGLPVGYLAFCGHDCLQAWQARHVADGAPVRARRERSRPPWCRHCHACGRRHPAEGCALCPCPHRRWEATAAGAIFAASLARFGPTIPPGAYELGQQLVERDGTPPGVAARLIQDDHQRRR